MKHLSPTLACLALSTILASTALAAEKTYTEKEARLIADWNREQEKAPPVADYEIEEFTKRNKGKFTKKDIEDLSVPTTVTEDPDEPKSFLSGFKIRESHEDVLESEDATINDPREDRDELTGASFGFVQNYKSDHDDLTLKGALIYPMSIIPDTSLKDAQDKSFHLKSLDFIPSVTVNKFEGEDEDDEVDSLVFRAGIASHFISLGETRSYDLDIRGYATYGTDTSFDGQVIAGEFDIEPLSWQKARANRFNLGYETGICPVNKGPDSTPGEENTFGDNYQATYSIRTYIHGEFGEVVRNDNNKDVEEGGFFRLGPVIKASFKPCGFSRMLGRESDAISLTASYSWLPDVDSSDLSRDELFTAGIEFSPFPSDGDRKASIKLLYEYGGIDLTKDTVDSLTLGLGVTF